MLSQEQHETAVPETVFLLHYGLLHHGDSFILLFNAFYFIDRNVYITYVTSTFQQGCNKD